MSDYNLLPATNEGQRPFRLWVPGTGNSYAYGQMDGNNFMMSTQAVPERSYWGETVARAIPPAAAMGMLFARPRMAVGSLAYGAGVGTSRIAGDILNSYLDTRGPMKSVRMLMDQGYSLPQAEAMVAKHWKENEQFKYKEDMGSHALGIPFHSADVSLFGDGKRGVWPWMTGAFESAYPQLRPGSLEHHSPQEVQSMGSMVGATESLWGAKWPLALGGAALSYGGGHIPDLHDEEGNLKPKSKIYSEGRMAAGLSSIAGPTFADFVGRGLGMALGGTANSAREGWRAYQNWKTGGADPAQSRHLNDQRLFEESHMVGKAAADGRPATGEVAAREASEAAEATLKRNLASRQGGQELQGNAVPYAVHAGQPAARKVQELSGKHSGKVQDIGRDKILGAQNWIEEAERVAGLNWNAADSLPAYGQRGVATGGPVRQGIQTMAGTLWNRYRAAHNRFSGEYGRVKQAYNDMTFELDVDDINDLLREDRVGGLVNPSSSSGSIYRKLMARLNEASEGNQERIAEGMDAEPITVTGREIIDAIQALRDAGRRVKGYAQEGRNIKHEIRSMATALRNLAESTPEGREMMEQVKNIDARYRSEITDVFFPKNNKFLQDVFEQIHKSGHRAANLNTTAISRGLIGKNGEINVENYRALRTALGDDAVAMGQVDGMLAEKLRQVIHSGRGNAAAKLQNFVDQNPWIFAAGDDAGQGLRRAILGGSEEAPSILDNLIHDVFGDSTATTFNTLFRDAHDMQKFKAILAKRYGNATRNGQPIGDFLLQMKASEHIRNAKGGAVNMLEQHRPALKVAFEGNEVGLQNLEALALLRDNIHHFDAAMTEKGADALKGFRPKNPVTQAAQRVEDVARNKFSVSIQNLAAGTRSALRRQQSWPVAIATYFSRTFEGWAAKDLLNALFAYNSTGPRASAAVNKVLEGKKLTPKEQKVMDKIVEQIVNNYSTSRMIATKGGMLGYDPSSGQMRAERQSEGEAVADEYDYFVRTYGK